MNITWNAPSSDGGYIIKYYTIYKTTALTGPYLFETFSIENISYYNDTDVSNDETYSYKVSAVNVIGEGPLSDEVSATPEKKITSEPGVGFQWLCIIIPLIALVVVGFIIPYLIRK